MSGIVGTFYLDGRDVRGAALRKMLTAIAHRGPDGAALWCEGPVGIGRCLLGATPESMLTAHRALVRDACVVAADIRIDNRGDLCSRLGLHDSSADPVTDEEIVRAAYLKWGTGCPEHLLGDFAFVVWDARRARLFCARDHFGIRPLYYYYRPGVVFALASEVKALLQLQCVPRSINEQRIGDYLAGIVCDKEATFYSNILRIPPGHAAEVTPGGMRLESYWRLERGQTTAAMTDAEYAEAFREKLSDAVRARLRSSTAVGSLLSGGLDSSSITALADKHASGGGAPPIHTFSTVFDELSDCDESTLIRQMLARGSYESHFINGDRCDHVGSLRAMVRQCDGPIVAPNAAMRWRQLDVVRERGIRVLIEGTGGDEIVSHGYGYVDDLAREGRWLTLSRELSGLVQIHGDSFVRWYWMLLLKHRLYPAWSRSIIRRAYRRGRRAILGPSLPVRDVESYRWSPLLDHDFARRIQLPDRFHAWRRELPESARGESERHYRVLSGPLQSAAFEILDALGAGFSVENRLPFWDKRLVEFCYGLPSDQKLRDGWGRAVMRRAMAPLLPEDVVWRKTKTNFLPSLQRALCSESRASMQQIMQLSSHLEPYVDLDTFRDAYKRVVEEQDGSVPQDVFWSWTVAGLALWLDEQRRDTPIERAVESSFWRTPLESNVN